jgi:hypothetical protein
MNHMRSEVGLARGEDSVFDGRGKNFPENVELYKNEKGEILHRFIGTMEGYEKKPSEADQQVNEKKVISSEERKKLLNEAQNVQDILKVFETTEMVTGHDRTYRPEYLQQLIKSVVENGDEEKLQHIENIDNLHEAVKRVIKLKKWEIELSEINNKRDLEQWISRVDSLQGSAQEYSATELKEILDDILDGKKEINYATSTCGFRSAVMRVRENEESIKNQENINRLRARNNFS